MGRATTVEVFISSQDLDIADMSPVDLYFHTRDAR